MQVPAGIPGRQADGARASGCGSSSITCASSTMTPGKKQLVVDAAYVIDESVSVAYDFLRPRVSAGALAPCQKERRMKSAALLPSLLARRLLRRCAAEAARRARCPRAGRRADPRSTPRPTPPTRTSRSRRPAARRARREGDPSCTVTRYNVTEPVTRTTSAAVLRRPGDHVRAVQGDDRSALPGEGRSGRRSRPQVPARERRRATSASACSPPVCSSVRSSRPKVAAGSARP